MSNPPKVLAAVLLSSLLSSLLFGLAACGSTSLGVDGGYLSWSPPGLWLTAPAGGQASATVTLTNSGNQADDVSSIAVTGATRPVFTVSTTSLTVSTDAGIGLTVTYSPPSCLDAGDDLADLSFVTDSTDASGFTLPLVGICTPAAVDAGVSDAGADAGLDAGDDAGPDAG